MNASVGGSDRHTHWWQREAATRQDDREPASFPRRDRHAERLPESHRPHLPDYQATDMYRSRWVGETARTGDSTPRRHLQMMPSQSLENPRTFPLRSWQVHSLVVLLAVRAAWLRLPSHSTYLPPY